MMMAAPISGSGMNASRMRAPTKYWVSVAPICAPMAAPVCMTNAIENVHIALEGMGKGAIARGNDDFKQVSAHGDVRRNAEQINHGRHADVPGAAAKKTAEKSADERDDDDGPDRNALDAGGGQADVRREAADSGFFWRYG